jgi:pimeloyl-ACP methyl ester carboxylesterase
LKLIPCSTLLLLLSTAIGAHGASSMREGDVEVGSGVRIHYVDGGDPQAKITLLFIPGWSMSTAVWRDQMNFFADSARVVSIDPRSQGLSTVTLQLNTPEQRAKDLHEVIKSLAIPNVVLVGWSQGVQDVAAYAAAFNGEGVSGYVLVDAAVGQGAAAAVAQPELLKGLLERLVIYQEHQKEYLHGMMNAIIQSPEGRKRIDEYVHIGLRTPPDLGVSMLMMDFIAYDRRPALAKFNRPTLIVAAAQSGELEVQRQMSRQIKDAKLEIIDNAGHAVFIDQPQRFRSLLADFVQRL